MSDYLNLSELILNEINTTLNGTNQQEIKVFENEIIAANRIFFAGAGRTSLMIRSFAMRLMQLGLKVHVIGETTTPSITENDLLIIGSGSGGTESLCVMAQKAKKIGAKIGLITIYPESVIGRLSDFRIVIPTTTSKVVSDERKSVQPGGSTFEQSLLILCEVLVISISNRLKIDDWNKEIMLRHANLE